MKTLGAIAMQAYLQSSSLCLSTETWNAVAKAVVEAHERRKKSPGQKAYEAFFSSDAHREWSTLPREDREAWELAAQAAREGSE